jgi:hypothetical protein
MTNLFLQGVPTARRLLPTHWPMGPAILWLPFFFRAHLFVLIQGYHLMVIRYPIILYIDLIMMYL